MITVIFVEGKLDYFFFVNILINIKNYLTSTIVDCWGIQGFNHYFRTIKTKTILKKDSEYLVIIQGMGKGQTIKQFVYLMKELLKNTSQVNKALLIIDEDTATTQDNVVFGKLTDMGKTLNDCKFGELKKHKYLSESNVKRRSIQIKTGLLEVAPNLDHVVATFLKDHNVIPESLLKADYDGILENAVSHLQVNGFEGLCDYIFKNKSPEIVRELNRIGLDDVLCKFL